MVGSAQRTYVHAQAHTCMHSHAHAHTHARMQVGDLLLDEDEIVRKAALSVMQVYEACADGCVQIRFGMKRGSEKRFQGQGSHDGVCCLPPHGSGSVRNMLMLSQCRCL